MFFETLENDIKARLVAKVTGGVQIETMPEKQADFSRPFSQARVTVCYKQSEYTPPENTEFVAQEETLQVEIVIEARNLRGTNGVYDVFDKARKAVVGYKPTNCRKIYAIKFGVEEYKENLWYYNFTVACKSIMVELPDEVSEPLATQISATVTPTTQL